MAFGESSNGGSSQRRALAAAALAAQLSALDPTLANTPETELSTTPIASLTNWMQPNRGLMHLSPFSVAPAPSFTAPSASVTGSIDQPDANNAIDDIQPIPDLTEQIQAIDEGLEAEPIKIRNDGPLVASADPNAIFQRNQDAAYATHDAKAALANIKEQMALSQTGLFAYTGARPKNEALATALASASVSLAPTQNLDLMNYLRPSSAVGAMTNGISYKPEPYTVMPVQASAVPAPQIQGTRGLYERTGIAHMSLVADVRGINLDQIEADIGSKDREARLAYDTILQRAGQGVKLGADQLGEVLDRQDGQRLEIGNSGITYRDVTMRPSGMG